MEIAKAGKYDVFLEWSVSDETAGNPFVFETGDKALKGKVGKSGSWETFKNEEIGQVDLKPGLQTMPSRNSLRLTISGPFSSKRNFLIRSLS